MFVVTALAVWAAIGDKRTSIGMDKEYDVCRLTLSLVAYLCPHLFGRAKIDNPGIFESETAGALMPWRRPSRPFANLRHIGSLTCG